jgi:hypothetical protein
MQVIHGFIILNMNLTLNHAAVDISLPLTRKPNALLPVKHKNINSYICYHYKGKMLFVLVLDHNLGFFFNIKERLIRSLAPPTHAQITHSCYPWLHLILT